MVINENFIDKNGKKYDGVTEKAFEKGELFDIGKFKHQTEREKNVFGKENGVYIYQDIENDNLAYRIYDEFAEYGFNGYHDDVLIYELNKRKENVKRWLIDNHILDKSDFSIVRTADNTQANDIRPIDINTIEGD